MKTTLATILCSVVAAMIGTAGASAQAPDGLTALSESAVFDPVTGQVSFTLTLNRAPDFETVDEFGRQADAFQYYILGDLSLPYPAYYDSIIRGEEIHAMPGVLRIRDPLPSNPDPATGGWGPIRGEVPYRLEGNVLTFSVALSTISDHSVDGRFSYELLLTRFGASTQVIRNQSTVRPSGPTSKDQCKNGGWRTFGVFKNQGDCVSFVATKGKNPPAAGP
jgi:hypothetical protein